MGWYLIWLAGLFLILVPLFKDAGLYYNDSDSAYLVKFLLGLGWSVALVFFAKWFERKREDQ